jgi:Patatin-like phospholipase
VKILNHIRSGIRPRSLLSGLLIAAVCSGCGSLRPRNSVPASLVDDAQIPGVPGARMLAASADVRDEKIDAMLGKTAIERAKSLDRPVMLLALSGGGADGAFGAGLLCGWTEAGDRPEFDIVTGISTGALLAPYAFLGSKYDAEMKQGYTTITDKDVFKTRGIFGILHYRDALTSSTPLEKLIEKQFDQARIDAIAAEHRKGRRFYVGTSDLDAERLAVWDMGAIAASGHPSARKLFCRVLLASASIPVAFPPVYFDVEAAGKRYDEMHADGGVLTQVFGTAFLSRLTEHSGRHQGRLFLVRNAQLHPEWQSVQPKLSSIAGRSVSTMIKTQGYGDLYRAYVIADAGHLDFNLAAIPEDFAAPREGEFDPAFMQVLFNTAYQKARHGYPWSKVPPAVEPAPTK